MTSPFDHIGVDQKTPSLEYSSDESDIEGVLPDAVLLPRNEEELRRIVALARKTKTPLFARGLGSGRAGAATCTGGVVLSFEKMASILDIDCENNRAWVEPFVLHADLQRALHERDRFYGPDPNSSEFSTLGGNVATNASGPKSYRYGATRDWVTEMEVVSGEGILLRVGFPVRKWSTGYDTLRLLIGSEGTLALTRKICVRIAPKPERTSTLVLGLRAESEVPAAVADLHRFRPTSLEVLDQTTLSLLRRHSANADLPRGAALLALDFEGDAIEVETAIERAGNDWSTRALDTRVLVDNKQRASFWDVRKQMSRLLRSLAKHKISEDVVVPVANLYLLWQSVARIAEEHQLIMPAYGHAGDGNLHVNLLWDSPEQKGCVDRALEALFATTLQLGGTLSGEHGIGLTKAPFLSAALGTDQIALQRAIKNVFDPDGILNPGKIFTLGHSSC